MIVVQRLGEGLSRAAMGILRCTYQYPIFLEQLWDEDAKLC